jgi:hypothetical protein
VTGCRAAGPPAALASCPPGWHVLLAPRHRRGTVAAAAGPGSASRMAGAGGEAGFMLSQVSDLSPVARRSRDAWRLAAMDPVHLPRRGVMGRHDQAFINRLSWRPPLL